MKPGQTVKLHARLFDDRGRFLREEKATWSLDGLKGTVADGTFTVAGDPKEQAGLIKAAVGELKADALDRNLRVLSGWRLAARLDQRDAREVQRRDAGWPEGPAEGGRRFNHAADPLVLRRSEERRV